MSQTGHSLKAALVSRVDPAQAERLAQDRILLGGSTSQGGCLCPAGANKLYFDVYMRPVNPKTLKSGASPDCSGPCGVWNAQKRIEVENVERPYLPICAAGFRGGDPLGVGRDITPMGIYDGTNRGKFIRHYNTPNNAPPDRTGCSRCPTRQHYIPKQFLSQDATIRQFRG